ncbi:MAG: hypothetical protein U1F56_05175 [Rubrivivax sp.]
MTLHRFTRLSAALALAFAGSAACAQLAVRAPVALQPAAGSGSLTTTATVQGSLTQSSKSGAANADTEQTLVVAGARGASIDGGQASAQATVTGAVTQTRGSGGLVRQEIGVAELSGRIAAGTARAEGVVLGSLTQSATSASASSLTSTQRIQVGSLADVQGGSIVTRGTVAASGSINQAVVNGFTVSQNVNIADVRDSTLQSAQTNGTLAGNLSQTSTTTDNFIQRVDIGNVAGSNAGTVVTSGVVTATLSQSLGASADSAPLREQTISVGSERFSSAASVRTDAVLAGSVAQSGGERQFVGVAFVSDAAGSSASARAAVDAAIVQTGTARSSQTFNAGGISGSNGTATSDATVSGRVTQTSSARSSQLVSVAAISSTTGTVSTKAALNGEVTQSARSDNANQLLSIGSVSGNAARSVTTDVTVTGAIVQNADGGGSGRTPQTIQIGGVTAP